MRIPALAVPMVGLALALLHSPAGSAPHPPAGSVTPDRSQQATGIRWQTSLAAAQATAARTGKPLFLLHLFGRLDEAFC